MKVFKLLYGYGDTELEAMEECIKFFDELQEEYNPERVSL